MVNYHFVLIIVIMFFSGSAHAAGLYFADNFAAANLTNWESRNPPTLRSVPIAGDRSDNNKAVEFNKNRQDISRKELNIRPGKNGCITAQWDMRHKRQSGHINLYMTFGQGKKGGNVSLWLYVPNNSHSLMVFNQADGKSSKLTTLKESYDYRFIDVINTARETHTLTILAHTGEKWVRIFRSADISMNSRNGKWNPKVPLRFIKIFSGVDCKKYSVLFDNISIKTGAETMNFPKPAPVSYKVPPKRVIWLEGEDCRKHNWTVGPSYHCWTYEWCGVHGGVLDLASCKLPDSGAYIAEFPFVIEKKGEYTIYYLGRSTYQASPINWSIDSGKTKRYPPAGEKHSYGELAVSQYIKYSVMELGTVNLQKGKHTLKISVTEPYNDGCGLFYSQQIDAIAISHADYPIGQQPPDIKQKHSSYELWKTDDIIDGNKSKSSKGAPLMLWAGDFLNNDSSRDGSSQQKQLQFGSRTLPELNINKATAGISALLASRNGTKISRNNLSLPLLSVRFISGRRSTVVGDLNWKTDGNRTICTGTGDGFKLKLVFETRSEAAEIFVGGEVKNMSAESIDSIRWTLLDGIALGDNWRDDKWILAAHRYNAGDVGKLKSMVSPLFEFDWVSIYDTNCMFYCFFKDREMLDTRVVFRGHKEESGGTLMFEKFPRIDPGETYLLPPLVIGASETGDWHEGGDRFREWWYSWAKDAYIPNWFKSIGGMAPGPAVRGWSWSQVGNMAPEQKTINFNLARQKKIAESTGIETFHGADWLPRKTEGWYPKNYVLTAEQLARMKNILDGSSKLGAKYSIYTNPLLYSRVVPSFPVVGHDLIARARDGEMYLTEHTSRHHPMALPYPGLKWARLFTESIKPVVALTNVSALYLDQLGAVPAHLDYSKTTGHRHFGQWTAGSAGFCKYVIEQLRKDKPELVIGIEHPNPAIQQYATYGLLVYGDRPSQILRYIFPGNINFVGSFNSATPEQLEEFAKEALLTGLPLYFGGVSGNKPVTPIYRKIIMLKKIYDPQLYDGVFRDSIGMKLSKGLRAKVFVFKDGKLMIPFVRDTQKGKLQIVIKLKALAVENLQKAGLVSVDAPGRRVSLDASFDKDKAVIEIPHCQAGIIILD